MTDSCERAAAFDLAALRAVTDPRTRAAEATGILTALTALVREVSAVRDEALLALRAAGASYGEIAVVTGLTRGRVAQVVRRRDA